MLFPALTFWMHSSSAMGTCKQRSNCSPTRNRSRNGPWMTGYIGPPNRIWQRPRKSLCHPSYSPRPEAWHKTRHAPFIYLFSLPNLLASCSTLCSALLGAGRRINGGSWIDWWKVHTAPHSSRVRSMVIAASPGKKPRNSGATTHL